MFRRVISGLVGLVLTLAGFSLGASPWFPSDENWFAAEREPLRTQQGKDPWGCLVGYRFGDSRSVAGSQRRRFWSAPDDAMIR